MSVNFCPNCGTKTNGANFCPNCGMKISEPASQPKPAASAQRPASSSNTAAFSSIKSSNQDLLKRFGLHGQQAEQPQNSQLPPEPTTVTPKQANIPPEPDTVPPTAIPEAVQPLPPEPTSEPVVVKAVAPSDTMSHDDKKKILDEIVNEPVIPDSSTVAPSKGPRIKRPEKKNKNKPSIINSFFSAGYDDEAAPDDQEKVKIVQDDLYNKSFNDYVEYEEEKQEPEKPQKKKSRSANTTGAPSSRGNSAIIQKATNVAAKHLIDEDKKLEDRHRVYIVEQDEMADPNDPTYDGYYENIIPIDESARVKAQEQGKKFTINEETKKTLLILLGLFAALIVVILINF